MIYKLESDCEYTNLQPKLANHHKADSESDEHAEVGQMGSPQRIVGENYDTFISKKNIFGTVKMSRWGRKRTYFFGLELKKGRMICYKKIDSKSKATYYTLSKAKIVEKIN